MKSLSIPAAIAVLLFTLALAVVAQKPAPQPQERPRNPAPALAGSDSAEGEKRFEIHCGRCHVPPDDLSPREAKAVLRQMRVRANLSAEDERLILKYLAP